MAEIESFGEDQLAELLTPSLAEGDALHLRRGVVTAVDLSTFSATVTINTVSIPGIKCYSSVGPVIGDVVDVLFQGSVPIIIGKVSGSASPTSIAPRGIIGFNKTIGTTSGIWAETDIVNLSASCTVVGTNRYIEVTHYVPDMSATIAGDIFAIRIKEGAAQLQERDLRVVSAIGTLAGYTAVVLQAPSAGVHTYKISIVRLAGSGTINHIAAASAPAYIKIEDKGPMP